MRRTTPTLYLTPAFLSTQPRPSSVLGWLGFGPAVTPDHPQHPCSVLENRTKDENCGGGAGKQAAAASPPPAAAPWRGVKICYPVFLKREKIEHLGRGLTTDSTACTYSGSDDRRHNKVAARTRERVWEGVVDGCAVPKAGVRIAWQVGRRGGSDKDMQNTAAGSCSVSGNGKWFVRRVFGGFRWTLWLRTCEIPGIDKRETACR